MNQKTVVVMLAISAVISSAIVYSTTIWSDNRKADRAQEFNLAQQKICLEKGKQTVSELNKTDPNVTGFVTGDYIYYSPEQKCIMESMSVINTNSSLSNFYNISDLFTGTTLFHFVYGTQYSDYSTKGKLDDCKIYNDASLKYFGRKGPIDCSDLLSK